jgi:hypothetical protein
LLKAVARQWLAAGQGELDLGLNTAVPGGPLPITSSQMRCLLDALEHAYRALGFDRAAELGERLYQHAHAIRSRIADAPHPARQARVS